MTTTTTTTPTVGDTISSLVDHHLRAIRETFDGILSEQEKDAFAMQFRSGLAETLPSVFDPPRIQDSIVECIGSTKMVRLQKIPSVVLPDDDDDSAEIVAKLEFTNPGFSVKDRIARNMLEEAEKEGTLKPGVHTIVDITSGNTGIGWGVVAAARGYNVVQVIPEPYSMERRALMMALGVEVVVSKKSDGFGGALKIHREIVDKLGPDKAWVPLQFSNIANIRAHSMHTGPEIWEQCGGKIDAIVAGYGTGGTISGITEFLRSKNPDFKCFAVEPMENSLLNGDQPGPHGIQGIAPSFLPSNMRVEIVDEVIRCPTAEAMKTARDMARHEGIAVGISAGANVWGACQIAKRPEMKGKRIVTILPSAAERYMSTALYKSIMEEAKNLPLSSFDPNTEIDPDMKASMLSLEKHKELGTAFRTGFRVV